jgi:hypothetical protein
VVAASIREAVTVGGNVLLTFGKEIGITKASTGILVIWKNLRGKVMKFSLEPAPAESYSKHMN